MSDTAVPGSGSGGPPDASAEAYIALQAEPDFRQLKAAFRRFAFPVTAAFLSWYLLYVLMSAWARGIMDTKILGNINLALVFGLLQFVSTFALTWLYERHMNRHVDPLADRILATHESGTPASVDVRGERTSSGPEVTR